jgi:hypothetical protein
MKTSFNDDIPSIEDRLCALEHILHCLLHSLPDEIVDRFLHIQSRELAEIDRDQPDLAPVAEEISSFLQLFAEDRRRASGQLKGDS